MPEFEAAKVSIVVPIYQGENTITTLAEEITALRLRLLAMPRPLFKITELILVHDCGPDNSDQVIRKLEAESDFIRVVWLSRNFGQHAATLAGMASSRGDWIVTMDEDGQHNPEDIDELFAATLESDSDVVYAKPLNPPPHGAFRNRASLFAKKLLSSFARAGNPTDFQSFRLIRGNLGRSVAAYAGAEIYLDIALSWFTTRIRTAPVTLRDGGARPSGYSLPKLFSHFWKMVLTSGTRPLRAVSLLGVIFAALGVIMSIILIWQRIFTDNIPSGWTSLAILGLFSTGAILLALGIVAEYLGVILGMAQGKPPYLIIEDRQKGSSAMNSKPRG